MFGILHICDDEKELPPREDGLVDFELGHVPFECHGDPAKTRGAQHPHYANWWAVGDVGSVDEDGLLYLTDRKSFMIVSGGVNICPQDIEDVLVTHPAALDAAVIGVPTKSSAKRSKAVVQRVDGAAARFELTRALLAHCRAHRAAYKVPPVGRLHRRAPPPPHRQALQAPPPRPLLGGHRTRVV